MTTAVLTRPDFAQVAPSVLATRPYEGVSSHYRFLPTIDVVEMMQEHGFFPVMASQSRARIEGKKPFTKHMVRLRHRDNLFTSPHEEIPEIVLVNSHDRTAAYKLFSGIFRMVCSNGMIIQSENFGSFSLRHSGSHDLREQVIDTTFRIVEQVPATMETIKEWKQLQLPAPVQMAYAEAAHVLRDMPNIKPAQLLQGRRKEDAAAEDGSRSLWHTLNVCEENMMKGGLTARNTRGRKVSTRPIKSVSEDVRLNRSLWVLASQLASTMS